MAYTTINKSSDYFNTKLYTGNATDNTAITGVGHQPSFLWGKNITDNGTNWYLIDAVRGVTKEINSNSTAVDGTDATLIKSFNSDGFTLGDGSLNQSGKEFISWNWKANGQGSSNTDGSINTIYNSVSTTSGFSIIKYTGTGSAGATIGHGLGVKPAMIIIKNLNLTQDWVVYHQTITANKIFYLNMNNEPNDNNVFFNDTEPTSSLITLGSNSTVNGSGNSHIAYCFAEVKGFSKFGSFNGNANANGAFVYTGFAPAFVLTKAIDGGAENWFVYDNGRSPFNVRGKYLTVDGTGGNSNSDAYDFLSNGLKLKTSANALNGSRKFSYMAFAEAPLVGSNNVPANAR